MQTKYKSEHIEKKTITPHVKKEHFPVRCSKSYKTKFKVSYYLPPYPLLKATEAYPGDVSILQFPVQRQAHYNINHY